MRVKKNFTPGRDNSRHMLLYIVKSTNSTCAVAMEWKDYADFTVADFVADDFFMEWVLQPNEENQAFWQDWQQHYPEKQAMIAAAQALLLSMEYDRQHMPEESYDRIWHSLHQKMEHAMPETMHYDRPQYYRRGWRKAAIFSGVCATLALGVFWFLNRQDQRAVYTSQFGENRRLLLPDSSVVILGPHSALKATAFSRQSGAREVWLDGEAYFIIKPKPLNAQPFMVHTGNLDIEVLGTEFNVSNYNGRPQVVLHSGRVALRDHADKKERIVMEPGELVEYSTENQYIRKKVTTEKYLAWVDHTLVFDNISLEDVAVQLQNKYGIQVLFADSSLRHEQFSATLEQADHKVVLKAVQEAFSIQLTQQDEHTFVLSR